MVAERSDRDSKGARRSHASDARGHFVCIATAKRCATSCRHSSGRCLEKNGECYATDETCRPSIDAVQSRR
jgi:hypothetical protein